MLLRILSRGFFSLCVCITSNCGRADTLGVESTGISSMGLGLTGQGIAIGQVELSRPPVPGLEDPVDVNTDVNPKLVALLGTSLPAEFPSSKGVGVDFDPDPMQLGHALWVAGVMISTDAIDSTGEGSSPIGVSSGASLYASAGVPVAPNEMRNFQLATNWVATQGADENGMRAINSSYGLKQNVITIEQGGNSQLSLFIDWSASKYDVLHVVAGAEGTSQVRTPQDNFNGMTIGWSNLNSNTVTFDRVGVSNLQLNEDSGRTHIDLIAPGVVEVTDKNNAETLKVGTSFAAPYVTGTVALLQEYADERILNSGNPLQWNPNARRHEVMKAVLMNSADKLIDDGTVILNGNAIPEGKLLGMSRTVLKKNGDNWFDSNAYREFDDFFQEFVPDDDTPLDEEMGAGHLNAKRALQQFLPGEQEMSGARNTAVEDYADPVSTIGWDYGTISGEHPDNPATFPLNRYLIDGTLEAGDFISIVLGWDRKVEFANDADMDGEFDINDTFADGDLTNLDLYLAPKGTNDIGDDVMLISESEDSSIEHIFAEIPFDGEWEIWVFRNEQFAPPQDYALAWQYGLAPELPELEPPTLSGDFDNDGDVDGADFLVWQRNPSVDSLSAWQSEYGTTGALAAANVVPEPSSLLLMLVGLGLPFVARRKSYRS